MFYYNKDGIDYCSNIGPNGEMIQYQNNSIESNHTVYSDRMFQWDSKKYNELCDKHFGNQSQYFYEDRSHESVEKFLIEYISKDIILQRIVRYVNASNGFPYWRFDYYEQKPV